MSNRVLFAIIVDDSAQARKLLKLMLKELSQAVEVVAEAANVEEAVKKIKTAKPDIVFLDIDMPGKSGLQLAEEISREEIPYEIIFTTAFNEYALRAFRLAAIDYLLKPIDETQLADAVNRVAKLKLVGKNTVRLQTMLNNMKAANEETISVPSLNGYIFLKVADISYVKANGSYAEIFIAGKSPLTVSKNLKYFEGVLSSFPQFIRVHRSYLINMRQMQRFDKSDRGIIIMNDGAAIDLARERREVFFNALKSGS